MARAMFDSVGWSPTTDTELDRTPERFTTLLADYSNFGEGPEISIFPAPSGEMVTVTAMAFRSLCVHHVMPFFGFVDVAYIPNDQACGFGGILRVVEHFSKRPQVQERLVKQIASHLNEQLKPKGVLVRCRARQMCVELRRTDASPVFVTTEGLGVLSEGDWRNEAMATFNNHEPLP